jgi:hypothetical protein
MREGRIEGRRKDGKREKGEHEGRGERRGNEDQVSIHISMFTIFFVKHFWLTNF